MFNVFSPPSYKIGFIIRKSIQSNFNINTSLIEVEKEKTQGTKLGIILSKFWNALYFPGTRTRPSHVWLCFYGRSFLK